MVETTESEYLTTRQVAQLLHVSEDAVRRWVSKKQLRTALRLGGKAGNRFNRGDVEAFVRSRELQRTRRPNAKA